ncbi:MAG: hypothetical protein ACI4ME_07325 [Aristaeellaceae bacterium]
MVIDRNDAVAPLFWYVYVPHTSSRRSDHGSKDGFNVALYPNNTLVYCRFNANKECVDSCTFQLPPEVKAQYLAILESQTWWMARQPREVHVPDRPSSTSMFGFTLQHPMFACQDLERMAFLQINSRLGIYARRLCSMLECMSEMLFDYGIELGVDLFHWNWQMIQPMNQMQGSVPPQQNWGYAYAANYGPEQYAQGGDSYYDNQDRMAQ